MTFGPVLDRDFDILRELWVSLVVNYIYDISLMTYLMGKCCDLNGDKYSLFGTTLEGKGNSSQARLIQQA